MAAARPLRLIIAIVIGAALALAVGLQALSSVATKASPGLAASLFPANGHAKEELADAAFKAEVTDPQDPGPAAREAETLALAAIKTAPIGPKAYAILALAQSDLSVRQQILALASQLNRRSLMLQALVLQEHIAREDYAATTGTLDQILRVHPERSQEFFPVLLTALEQDSTLPLFVEMLDGSSPWHARFLTFAVGQRDALPNLAKLRQEIDPDDENFDRRLIVGLAASGNLAEAETLYTLVADVRSIDASGGALDWRADFPPFEWQLSDEAGFRAQPSPDMQQLELAVRPGKGGAIAARLVPVPPAPFGIKIDHRIAPVDQQRDVRLVLVCAETQAPFFDERFSRQGDGFEVSQVPEGCEHMILGINARAWSGRSALSGTINEIRITSR